MQGEWRRPSNSGHYELVAIGTAARGPIPAGTSLYRIVTRGAWYQYHFDNNPLPAEHSSITLADVPIADERLAALAVTLRRWLAEPMEFRHDLSTEHGRGVQISLTVDAGKNCSLQKPVFAFRCETSSMISCVRWVIDQTCVRILAESIESR
jgi:hypothetical protein